MKKLTFLSHLRIRMIGLSIYKDYGFNIDEKFHSKVMKGYQILSKNDDRFYLIDASQSFKDIHLKIVNKLMNL